MTPAAVPADLSGPQPSWPDAALRLWSDATDHVLAQPDAWHPAPLQGERCLRLALGEILHEDPDQILITSGVRAATSVIGRDARTVLHERPSFTGTVAALRSIHPDLELVSWADLPAKTRPAAMARTVIWLTTPCRNPDGATLAQDDWVWVEAAAPSNRVVLNEIYRWFGPVTGRPDRVWLTGSLSKLAGSGAGLGWVRGPGVESLAEQQHSRPSRFWQRCWCYLLEHEVIRLFVDHTVRPAMAASRVFTTELCRVTGVDHRPGDWQPPFLLLPVPTATGREFSHRLRAEGIQVSSGEDFLATVPSIRVCFVNVSEAAARHAACRIGARLAADSGGHRACAVQAHVSELPGAPPNASTRPPQEAAGGMQQSLDIDFDGVNLSVLGSVCADQPARVADGVRPLMPPGQPAPLADRTGKAGVRP